MLSLCAATALSFSPTAQPMALGASMRVRSVSMAELPFGMGGDKVEANAATAAALDIAEIEAPVAPATPSAGAAAEMSVTFSDVELAEQGAKLQALSDKWKKSEEEEDYQSSIRSGFGPSPEAINGRSAMFFILVGLITEYYTGQSVPQQVYTLLQNLAIVE